MFYTKIIFYLIWLSVIRAISQINLRYTNEINELYDELQHNCLSIVIDPLNWETYREILTFCMSELPSKFHIEDDPILEFKFDQLAKENITSEQLYFWQTPIDIIEDYQFYLNELSTSNNSSLGTKIFYNCTLPRFGPKCQYQLYTTDILNHKFSDDIIREFYINFQSNPTNVTCYKHLQCNRGPLPMCLDWTEICDGIIDCFEGGQDEEYCWQLEINECEDNEYRCRNGQCISLAFFHDEYIVCDCIDGSDELNCLESMKNKCYDNERLSILCEDFQCKRDRVTSSCNSKRADILTNALVLMKNNHININCSSALTCLITYFDEDYLSCNNYCQLDICKQIIIETCPDLIYFPNFPVLFSELYLTLAKNDSQNWTELRDILFYLCYNNSYYNNYFLYISKQFLNNMTCIQAIELHPQIHMNRIMSLYGYILDGFQQELLSYSLNFNYNSEICNNSNMYQCKYSPKCISKFRLIDGIIDCPNKDDEDMENIYNTNFIEQIKKTFYKCETSNKYIHPSKLRDYICDCGYYTDFWCEDIELIWVYIHKNILFQHICDGYVDLFPINIDGRNQTDETDCEQWECNNIYTHLDGLWNCPNGEDEISWLSNCSSNYHLCVSIENNKLICLPIEKANDGIIDCLGGTDERILCRENLITNIPYRYYEFYCRNQSTKQCIHRYLICNDEKNCDNEDDEKFCSQNSSPIDTSKFWDSTFDLIDRPLQIHFKLPEMIISQSIIQNQILSISTTSIIKQSNCYNGLDLQVWLDYNKNFSTNTCLCPINSYGNQCQYQNQRVNINLKFQTLSDSWRTLFAIVIYLIDDSNQRIIHSYQQLTYLSLRDCKTKFHIHLIYSTRSKTKTKQYAIHIDMYEKDSFIYRGSVYFPIKFSFLPIHHLAYLINIPKKDNQLQICIDQECIHGKCIKYSNNPKIIKSFCLCDKNWRGKYCTIEYSCTCADDSLCIGISANNRSICICSKNKFGSRCFLKNRICENTSICFNGGLCIPNDDYFESNKKFTCICPKNFTGNQCEIIERKFHISFNENIQLSQQIFIHFIEINSKILEFQSIIRSSTFRTISIHNNSIIFYWSQIFHLVFIELFIGNYYLIYNQSNSNQLLININKHISLSDYCPHINEIFNNSLANLNLIHRIKYYHLPCQNQSLNLSCFHDEIHLCLCYTFNQKRLANCFKFEHNLRFNCLNSNNECEHDGICIQDHPKCPKKSICMCKPCSFGQRCQFSTNGFDFSLDAILGYHIQANIQIYSQPIIVQFSFILTIIFIILGFINSFLSLITFSNKIILEVGCGIYLLCSSFITLVLTIIFGLKFFFLFFVQINMISNRIFILSQCLIMDYFLRISLIMIQWLNACVAAERAVTTIKGVGFLKKKSQQTAIYIILILFIIISICCIHDPISRYIIDETNNDDDDDSMKRIWCTINYSSNLQLYNNIIDAFHFIIPFLINFISIIILIRIKIRQQLTIYRDRSYREIFWKQIKELKHLITAPIVLVILGVPRLILSYLLKCMNSINDAWLFLILYFISYIPAMVTFILFILPSRYYRKELQKTIKQYQTVIRKYLHF